MGWRVLANWSLTCGVVQNSRRGIKFRTFFLDLIVNLNRIKGINHILKSNLNRFHTIDATDGTFRELNKSYADFKRNKYGFYR